MRVSFEELLARDGKLVYKTRGVSMEPMLRQDRDIVVIRIPSAPLRKLDVALYKRGGDYVLHRVIRAKGDDYLIRGDNTFFLETVPASAVIGVLTAFQRKGKQYSVTDWGYRIYAHVWYAVYPLRALCFRFRRLAVHAAEKLGLLPMLRRMLGRKPLTK